MQGLRFCVEVFLEHIRSPLEGSPRLLSVRKRKFSFLCFILPSPVFGYMRGVFKKFMEMHILKKYA